MANVKAQAAKDKGNAAFKIGDYPTAIGHYTSAILADRTDSTYPLNRAAAYLKLGKNEDAERDCTIVLSLSHNNVKALFRRGQARLGMGLLSEGQQDFLQVLKLDQSNTSAQEELEKVRTLMEKEKAKKSRKPISSVQSSLEPNLATKRRRVPIKIVEPPAAATSDDSPIPGPSEPVSRAPVVAIPAATKPAPKADIMEAVSSRSLKSSPTAEILSPETKELPAKSVRPLAEKVSLPSKPTSFKDAKQARETAKSSRVGGGIFRASGDSTIFTNRDPNTADVPKSTPQAASQPELSRPPIISDAPAHKGPATLFDFVKTWGSTISDNERWQLLNTVPPSKFPTLCKTSLEPALLVSIMETFLRTVDVSNGNPGIKRVVADYMENFEKIPRFGTLLLFLSKTEKVVAKQVLTVLGVEKPTGIWSTVA
ncbi:hypothetical protein B0H34DRAFT_709282 [Crassisporium funariophilum]|nr:hypothetical protein B0H34DRAFT_709282 [Crassisporium funariophilum]